MELNPYDHVAGVEVLGRRGWSEFMLDLLEQEERAKRNPQTVVVREEVHVHFHMHMEAESGPGFIGKGIELYGKRDDVIDGEVEPDPELEQ
jgi:hypothetical protein